MNSRSQIVQTSSNIPTIWRFGTFAITIDTRVPEVIDLKLAAFTLIK
jgi:hypothetical protein